VAPFFLEEQRNVPFSFFSPIQGPGVLTGRFTRRVYGAGLGRVYAPILCVGAPPLSSLSPSSDGEYSPSEGALFFFFFCPQNTRRGSRSTPLSFSPRMYMGEKKDPLFFPSPFFFPPFSKKGRVGVFSVSPCRILVRVAFRVFSSARENSGFPFSSFFSHLPIPFLPRLREGGGVSSLF